jgi:RNA polymerase sigma-70 factor (ECF subfamily)
VAELGLPTDGLRDPEQERLLADSVGAALLIVLDRLDPAERLAFVLHDMFAVSFDEIASIVGRSPEAARQLASRARRRVQGAPAVPKASLMEQRRVVDAFLDALHRSDFEALVAVLDPDIVVTVDAVAASPGAPREIHGARNWAKGAIAFARQVPGTVQPMVVEGEVGLVWTPGGRVFRVLRCSFVDGKIARAEIIADPARLRELDLAVLDE